jgi:hypothetical protein
VSDAPKKKPGPKSRAKARALQAAAEAIKTGTPMAQVAAIARPVEKPSPPPDRLVSLGEPPPNDPLAANKWAHDAVIWALHDVMNDPDISSAMRRKEIRVLAASAAKLIPHARLWEAEQMIRADRADLEKKERAKRGAKLEPRPPRPPRAGSGPAT